MTQPLPAMLRFFRHVTVAEGGCWLWGAKLSEDGYGYFWFQGRTLRAHRWLYERVYGTQELELDHTCRMRACVRLDHLEPVTHQENVRRREEYRA